MPPLASMQHAFEPHDDETILVHCNRNAIKELLMQQWRSLTQEDIEATHYRKAELAELIERRYGIHHRLAENYLNNLQRTLPLTN